MLSKKASAIALLILSIVASFISFYTTNLILSDVGNMFYGVHNVLFLASIPGFFFTIETILLAFYIYRTYARPEHKKRITLSYLMAAIVLSALSLGCAIYTGAELYGSFTAPYPFPGYVIISIVVHTAIIVAAILLRVKTKKEMPEDTGKRKKTFAYVLYTIVLCVLVFFAFNRFGAFLWMPTYVHVETLYMTWSFYISLLLPMALLFHLAIFAFFDTKKHPNAILVNIVVVLVLTVIFALLVFIIGTSNTEYISVISPALAIERLATKPIDTVLHFVGTLAISIYLLVKTLHFRKTGNWYFNTNH